MGTRSIDPTKLFFSRALFSSISASSTHTQIHSPPTLSTARPRPHSLEAFLPPPARLAQRVLPILARALAWLGESTIPCPPPEQPSRYPDDLECIWLYGAPAFALSLPLALSGALGSESAAGGRRTGEKNLATLPGNRSFLNP